MFFLSYFTIKRSVLVVHISLYSMLRRKLEHAPSNNVRTNIIIMRLIWIIFWNQTLEVNKTTSLRKMYFIYFTQSMEIFLSLPIRKKKKIATNKITENKYISKSTSENDFSQFPNNCHNKQVHLLIITDNKFSTQTAFEY